VRLHILSIYHDHYILYYHLVSTKMVVAYVLSSSIIIGEFIINVLLIMIDHPIIIGNIIIYKFL
jgi:hypothetical protein